MLALLLLFAAAAPLEIKEDADEVVDEIVYQELMDDDEFSLSDDFLFDEDDLLDDES